MTAGVTASGQRTVNAVEGKRLAILAALCLPGLVGAGVLALDRVTTPVVGSALTTWGLVGGLVGLAGLLSGLLSILTWPGVVALSVKSIRSAELSVFTRVVIAAGCVAATFSAAFFLIWFVIIPLGGRSAL